jgi:hypothetical protein
VNDTHEALRDEQFNAAALFGDLVGTWSFPFFLVLLNSLIQDATELGDMLSCDICAHLMHSPYL